MFYGAVVKEMNWVSSFVLDIATEEVGAHTGLGQTVGSMIQK